MVSRQPLVTTPAPRPPTTGAGREAQRRRTRRALVEATRRLLAAGGQTPTIDAIAVEAEVSRRTVYMHFPTLDQLLLDAALGALSDAYVNTALESADGDADKFGRDVHARVEALVRALLDLAPQTLPLGRQIIRLTVETPAHQEPKDVEGVSNTAAPTARRGVRRTGWIEAAVAPIAEDLTPDQHRRLVAGLSLVIGFEAMVVLRDICALDPETEARTTIWAAHALIDAILAETNPR